MAQGTVASASVVRVGCSELAASSADIVCCHTATEAGLVKTCLSYLMNNGSTCGLKQLTVLSALSTNYNRRFASKQVKALQLENLLIKLHVSRTG